MKIALILANEYKHAMYSMSTMYLASYVRKYNPQVEFKLYDYIPEMDDIKVNEFDIIGISSMTVQYNVANTFGQKLRSFYDGLIILGGFHITLEAKLPDWADIGIIGEGEETLLELTNYFLQNRRMDHTVLKNIKGLIYHHNGQSEKTEIRPYVQNLDTIPFPARDLVDMDHYLKPNNVIGTKIGRGLSMMTSRGCGFHCDYCSTSRFWGSPRYHSADYVVSEMKHLVDKYHVEHIYIADDNFISHKKRLYDIADRFEKYQLEVELGASGRIEFYDQMRDVYKRMNIKALSFGFETGSDRMLKSIKGSPKLSVKESIEVAKRVHNDGVEIHGLFMINMPGETPADLDMTVKMIKELPLSKLAVSIATPYLETKWWDVAVSQGIVHSSPNSDFWGTYGMKVINIDKDRPLFKTTISNEKLTTVYQYLLDYQKQLFYFDWKNR